MRSSAGSKPLSAQYASICRSYINEFAAFLVILYETKNSSIYLSFVEVNLTDSKLSRAVEFSVAAVSCLVLTTVYSRPLAVI